MILALTAAALLTDSRKIMKCVFEYFRSNSSQTLYRSHTNFSKPIFIPWRYYHDCYTCVVFLIVVALSLIFCSYKFYGFTKCSYIMNKTYPYMDLLMQTLRIFSQLFSQILFLMISKICVSVMLPTWFHLQRKPFHSINKGYRNSGLHDCSTHNSITFSCCLGTVGSRRTSTNFSSSPDEIMI